MLVLTAVVTLAAICFTGEIKQHEHAFYACLLFIAGGAMGAFASLDLFFFYAFHELALIPTFLLIGIWGNRQPPARGLENNHLPGHRELHSSPGLDHALPERAGSCAQL